MPSAASRGPSPGPPARVDATRRGPVVRVVHRAQGGPQRRRAVGQQHDGHRQRGDDQRDRSTRRGADPTGQRVDGGTRQQRLDKHQRQQPLLRVAGEAGTRHVRDGTLEQPPPARHAGQQRQEQATRGQPQQRHRQPPAEQRAQPAGAGHRSRDEHGEPEPGERAAAAARRHVPVPDAAAAQQREQDATGVLGARGERADATRVAGRRGRGHGGRHEPGKLHGDGEGGDAGNLAPAPSRTGCRGKRGRGRDQAAGRGDRRGGECGGARRPRPASVRLPDREHQPRQRRVAPQQRPLAEPQPLHHVGVPDREPAGGQPPGDARITEQRGRADSGGHHG